ncbi:MAG: hypothetical protein V4456_16920 [Bacteroidota bacterium]
MEQIKKQFYHHYYRVNKNDTDITEVSINSFKPCGLKPSGALRLQSDASLFCLFTDIGQAMEKAKAGARAHIGRLIKRGEEGLPELLQYRMNHYEDLNINLIDANIQKEEIQMLADQHFMYKPYRIPPGNTGGL